MAMDAEGARVYEETRKWIAKMAGGPAKTTGALAPFTAHLLEHAKMTAAYSQHYEEGRAFAKKYYIQENARRNYNKDVEKKPGGRLKPVPVDDLIGSRVRRKLEHFLKIAESKDAELNELGEYIAFKTNTTWIQGPVKLIEDDDGRGAYGKTIKDNLLDWTKNKDLIRGTCAAKTEQEVSSIASKIQIFCTPVHGMSLIKWEQKKAAEQPLGYSDWNFAVVMKGSPVPMEIQVNTFAMLYGKFSKADYMRMVHVDVAEYEKTKRELGFEGGLQHLFYEIYQTNKGGPDAKAAAELSKKYCNMIRMNESERRAEAAKVAQEINVFHTKLETPGAKKIWFKRISICGPHPAHRSQAAS